MLSEKNISTLSLAELSQLAEDIRQSILSACLKNGGHLGASLGVVELAIALHRVFESPIERIVWDVGHQAYAHKILTGRASQFHTLRTTGGLSGFLSREESEHDVFGAGHSSTSISAALGMAWNNPKWTVAVIGDGGLTAGVAFEALNNVQALEHGPLLIVLNDNQMSISQNVGALSSVLAKGEAQAYFENFGLDYMGPVDGHDLQVLMGTLSGIKQGYQGRPILLHVLTQKGKGYTPAEERPEIYHGVSPVQISSSSTKVTPSWSDSFGQALCSLAAKDSAVVAITAAMPDGTGLTEFSKKFPKRFFDVGIAEPHAVTFAAGLATRGIKPVVAIYSTFLQRGIDALVHDVALQKLGVTIAVDRAGIVGPDGPTHHGVFDLVYLSMIPNLTVSAPSYLEDLEFLLSESFSGSTGGPYAIRYPRGKGTAKPGLPLIDGMRIHQQTAKPKLITVTLGSLAERVATAAAKADPKVQQVTVLSTVFAKPFSTELVNMLKTNPDVSVLIVEEGVIRGGFGEALIAEVGPRQAPVYFLGVQDHFVTHGSMGDLEEAEGFSEKKIQMKISEMVASQSV